MKKLFQVSEYILWGHDYSSRGRLKKKRTHTLTTSRRIKFPLICLVSYSFPCFLPACFPVHSYIRYEIKWQIVRKSKKYFYILFSLCTPFETVRSLGCGYGTSSDHRAAVTTFSITCLILFSPNLFGDLIINWSGILTHCDL